MWQCNGKYDGGEAYIRGRSHIFNYSLINKNFIGIDDDTCEKIGDFVFDVDRETDNRKCWFFSDNYNEKYGKHVEYLTPGDKDDCGEVDENKSEKIEFREIDMTDKICAVDNCNDRSASTHCNKSLAYDYIDELSGASQNSGAVVGNEARLYMLDEQDELYSRLTDLEPFDPENRVGPNGEAAANSIVNIKNTRLDFKLPKDASQDDRDAFRKYIETSVMPYLTQMIPSTTIFEWGFCCDDVEVPAHASALTQVKDVEINAHSDLVQVETDPIVRLTAYGELEQTYTVLCALTAYGELEQEITVLCGLTAYGELEQEEVPQEIVYAPANITLTQINGVHPEPGTEYVDSYIIITQVGPDDTDD